MSRALRIKEFPYYYVTDSGDVYSRTTGRIKKLKPSIDGHGYPKVELHKQKKQYSIHIHRLVAKAFIPNPENKPCVNHKNGITNDNRVENLEWVTCRENLLHRYHVLNKGGAKGKNNPLSKLVLQIKDGEVVARFYGVMEAQRKTNIIGSHISECCNNKPWRKMAGGYEWQYAKQRGKNNVPWIKPVLQIKDGKIIKEYCSAAEAQRQTGINNWNISACCYGRYGFKHAGGYEWKFKE